MSSSGGVLKPFSSADEFDQVDKKIRHPEKDVDEDSTTSPASEDDDNGFTAMREHSKTSQDTHGSGGGVRFGSVRVHKHHLTLGDNPSAHTVSDGHRPANVPTVRKTAVRWHQASPFLN